MRNLLRDLTAVTGLRSASAIAARRQAAANYRLLRATLRKFGDYF